MYWGQGCLVVRSLDVLQVSYIIALSDWRSKWCTEFVIEWHTPCGSFTVESESIWMDNVRFVQKVFLTRPTVKHTRSSADIDKSLRRVVAPLTCSGTGWFQNMWAEHERPICRSALKSIFVTPALRSAPAHPVFCRSAPFPLRSALTWRSDWRHWCTWCFVDIFQ